ncbi:MAG: tail fiber domain-containing protein [Rhodothermales bacterium]
MSNRRITFTALILGLAVSVAWAQAPDSLSFQGRLTDSEGNPIFASGLSITFTLYKAGVDVWHETQPVDVENGIFDVLLGKVTPLDTVRFNTAIDLGIKVDEDAEMTPRTPLAGVAYAKALPGFYTFYRDDLSGNKSYNVIGGAGNNGVTSGITGATISGGGGTSNTWGSAGNRVEADFATVSGGVKNSVSGAFSVIGGGGNNNVEMPYSAIGGGSNNVNDGYGATIGGGITNSASGSQAVIGGGDHNTASGGLSTIGGGSGNTASGESAMIPGGYGDRASGAYSFAAGYKALAKHEGSFVWNDRSVTSGNDSLLSTAENQFVVRATGGFGVNQAPTNYGIYLKQRPSGTETHHLMGIRIEFGANSEYWDVYHDLAGDINFGFNGTLKAFIDDADGTYYAVSDASLKEDVRPVRSTLSHMLELRPSTYHFKDAIDPTKRSLGFIAQEVAPLFPELVSEKDGLLAMNYSGLGVVAVKAIQEMYAAFQAKFEEQQAEIDQLKAALSSGTSR